MTFVFRVSCFVFRVSCFVFRVSCFVFRVSCFAKCETESPKVCHLAKLVNALCVWEANIDS